MCQMFYDCAMVQPVYHELRYLTALTSERNLLTWSIISKGKSRKQKKKIENSKIDRVSEEQMRERESRTDGGDRLNE